MKTGPIVCATRGGEASYRTQERAVALAKERGAELILLCVVYPSLAQPSNQRLSMVLEDELQRLGRSLLNIAKARAQAQGVEARTVCLAGAIWEMMASFLSEVAAGVLVIGAPKSSEMLKAFDLEDVADLARKVQESTGVEVVVVT